MSKIPSHIQVELKPLRKNSKDASYRVLEFADGVINKITTYQTIREAVYHAALNKGGDIVTIGPRGTLKAFYCCFDDRMKFGFGADGYEKSSMSSDFWWAF